MGLVGSLVSKRGFGKFSRVTVNEIFLTVLIGVVGLPSFGLNVLGSDSPKV